MGQCGSKKKKKEKKLSCKHVNSLETCRTLLSSEVKVTFSSNTSVTKSLVVTPKPSADLECKNELLLAKASDHCLGKTKKIILQLVAEIWSLNNSIGRLKTVLAIANSTLPRNLATKTHLLDKKSKTRLKPNKNNVRKDLWKKVLLSAFDEAGDCGGIGFRHLGPTKSKIHIQKPRTLFSKIAVGTEVTVSKSVQTQVSVSKLSSKLDVFVIPNLINIIPNMNVCGLESLIFKPLSFESK